MDAAPTRSSGSGSSWGSRPRQGPRVERSEGEARRGNGGGSARNRPTPAGPRGSGCRGSRRTRRTSRATEPPPTPRPHSSRCRSRHSRGAHPRGRRRWPDLRARPDATRRAPPRGGKEPRRKSARDTDGARRRPARPPRGRRRRGRTWRSAGSRMRSLSPPPPVRGIGGGLSDRMRAQGDVHYVSSLK